MKRINHINIVQKPHGRLGKVICKKLDLVIKNHFKEANNFNWSNFL